MKLYDILMRHAGQKSKVEFVLKRVLADDEEQILARIDKDLAHGCWTDKSTESLDEGEVDDHDVERNADGHRLFDIFEPDTYKVIGKETYLERMLRLRGEYHDEDADYDDAYYGIKHYGWSEGVEIGSLEAQVLLRLGIAEDWRAT